MAEPEGNQEVRRQQVTNLLTQIANVLGVDGPNTATAPEQITPSQTRPTPLPSPGSSWTQTPIASYLVRPSSLPSTTPVTTSSVLAEMRSRFAPYPPHAGRTRLAGRSAQGRRQLAVNQARNWTHRFFCLGGPRDTRAPNETRKAELQEIGLGLNIITALTNEESNHLAGHLYRAYPKLEGKEFELLRSAGSGRSRALLRLSSENGIPSVEYLRASRVSIIFVRPLESLEEEDTEGPMNDETLQNHTMGLESDSNEETPAATVMSHAQPDPSITLDNEVVTISDLRSKLYAENVGFQFIAVARDSFLEQVIGVYKDPSFDFNRKPKVQFPGEAGTDLGALAKEFFWLGLLAIVQERIGGRFLFEGEKDHMVPCADSRLLRSGTYTAIGKFMAHAVIHFGVGFVGLSEAIAEYLTTEIIDYDTPFTVSVGDIPELEIRNALHDINLLKGGASLSEEKLENIRKAAESSEFNVGIDAENAELAIETITYHQVIEKRKGVLEAIKSGFRNTKLLQFVSGKPYLRAGMFPRCKDLEYPPDLVIARIEVEGNPHAEVVSYVKDYIYTLASDIGGVRKLLCAWTGSAVIPDEALKLNVVEDEDAEFAVHVCFSQIDIPACFTKDQIYDNFKVLLEYNTGFGLV